MRAVPGDFLRRRTRTKARHSSAHQHFDDDPDTADRILLFAVQGFASITYWKNIVGMPVNVIVGAFIGTGIRYKISEVFLLGVIKLLLTLLAIRKIIITIV